MITSLDPITKYSHVLRSWGFNIVWVLRGWNSAHNIHHDWSFGIWHITAQTTLNSVTRKKEKDYNRYPHSLASLFFHVMILEILPFPKFNQFWRGQCYKWFRETKDQHVLSPLSLAMSLDTRLATIHRERLVRTELHVPPNHMLS